MNPEISNASEISAIIHDFDLGAFMLFLLIRFKTKMFEPDQQGRLTGSNINARFIGDSSG
jgi:hypothetical protein